MSNIVRVSEDSTLLRLAEDNRGRSDVLIAILQRISWGKLFMPKLVEQIFEAILALDPAFPILEKACRTISPWLYEYGPSDDYGWLDLEEFSMEHILRAYEQWRILSGQLIEGAQDFYSALEAARHSHTGPRHLALEKVREFAVMPEHLLDWVELKAELGYGMSENDHTKFTEIVTTYKLNIPTYREMTLSPNAVRSLKVGLEGHLMTIYKNL